MVWVKVTFGITAILLSWPVDIFVFQILHQGHLLGVNVIWLNWPVGIFVFLTLGHRHVLV